MNYNKELLDNITKNHEKSIQSLIDNMDKLFSTVDKELKLQQIYEELESITLEE